MKQKWFGNLDAVEETGEGTVSLKPWFDRQTTTFRLDVLGDWIEQLIELRNELHAEVYKTQETTDV